jgi:hypothetical protein
MIDEIKDMVDLATTVEKIGKVANFTELTPKNIKKITNAIKIVNDFNSKIESYGQHIFKTLYIDTLDGWLSRLSERDIERAFGKKSKRDDDRWGRYVLCYKTMTAYRHNGYGGWVMGASSGITTTYTFIENTLVVTDKWQTKEARFDHIPWISRERRWIIDLKTTEVVVEGDNINAYGR